MLMKQEGETFGRILLERLKFFGAVFLCIIIDGLFLIAWLAIHWLLGKGQSWFDPLAFKPVTEVRFGTAGFNTLRGPGTFNLDFGIFRRFAIGERHLEFRAQAFNATNTPHFGNPGANVSNMVLNPDGSIRSLGEC